MKGQLKLVRGLFRKAFAEGASGITEDHVRFVNALTASDVSELQRNGNLKAERIMSLGIDQTKIQEALSLLRAFLKGPSGDHLRNLGITVTKINEGMSLVEYEESDSSGDDKEKVSKKKR